MRKASWTVLGGLGLAGLVAACGYPDFEFRPKGEGGTETGTPSATGTGTGGYGGAATGAGGTGTATGTATGGSGGSGNAGGTGPTTCPMWPADQTGCSSNEKCSVVNETTGRTECVSAGTSTATTLCADDSNCVDRTWCDHGTGVCKLVCQSESDCAVGALCLNAAADGGGTIPGLKVCTAYCDPRRGDGCNTSAGPTNCLYGNSGFDCFGSGTSIALCDGFLDCAAPYTCFAGACVDWCDQVGKNCPPLIPVCHLYSPAIEYDGVALGYCALF